MRRLTILAVAVSASLSWSALAESPKQRTRGATLFWKNQQPAVELALPKDFEVESWMGTDSTTHRVFSKDDPTKALMEIYVGNFPSASSGLQEKNAEVLPDRIAGKNVAWQCSGGHASQRG